jgi:hypothetical protein
MTELDILEGSLVADSYEAVVKLVCDREDKYKGLKEKWLKAYNKCSSQKERDWVLSIVRSRECRMYDMRENDKWLIRKLCSRPRPKR